ncbi:MAG: CaiB/BaiF CoA transferase family protein [Gammaproteobacteria bacterium]
MFQLLRGVRVLESAVLLNGGTVGMLLSDLGAEVIKIEEPAVGDYCRDHPGQFAPRWSPEHVAVNRNKRSLALDLKQPAAKEAFFRLLARADVFIDGFRAGACDRLGIGYAAQRAAKPDIVYCQFSGYGAEGPYASVPCHGRNMNALAGGIPARMGDDGLVRLARGSQWFGGVESASNAPAGGAIYAALTIVSALHRRRDTGQGCYIDMSGADTVIGEAWHALTYNLNYDRIAIRDQMLDRAQITPDQEGGGGARYQLYETSDRRFILFCAIENKFWNNFCNGIGRTDWLIHGTHGSDLSFGYDEAGLRRELQAIFSTRTQAEWTEFAQKHNVAMGPAHRMEDLPEDPHLRHRGIFYRTHHPAFGEVTMVAYPALIDGERYGDSRPAPAHGEHTRGVLAEYGYSQAEIDAMLASGAVGTRAGGA